MKKIRSMISRFLCIAFFVSVGGFSHSQQADIVDWVRTPADISLLFPKTADDFNQRVQRAKEKANKALAEIISVPDDQRTFENTVEKLDRLQSLSDLGILRWVACAVERTSPDTSVRQAATEAVVEIMNYIVENIDTNVRLYNAIKSYAQGAGATDSLNDEERYFLTETLKDFQRIGLDLPQQERIEVIRLSKEIEKTCSEFETNIASDNRTISVTCDGLIGLDQDYIDSLQKNEKGDYLLGIDYPTINKVMTLCVVEDTRKRMQYALTNRAYPANEGVVKKLIAQRDELARRLGFASYNELNLDVSMVKNSETAQRFINQIVDRSSKKEQEEFKMFTSDLPDSIPLMRDGRIQAWNGRFVEEAYKKKHFDIDENEIAQYFPMEKTIKGLLDIYRQFLSVEFVEVPISGLWHEDVQLIEVYDKDKECVLGLLLLDLYPRPNKYNHACEVCIISKVKRGEGNDNPGLNLLICNFPKSTPTKPSLLNRAFVRTFFHEFGHALHNFLGPTQLATFSGARVKRDFVEMPSQMLEEWLWDKNILKNLSSHYITNQPLPDELIDKLIVLKNFDTGYYTLRQAYLAQLSLEFYKEGAEKDVCAIENDLYNRFFTNYYRLPESHSFASFNHLTDYGPQYYGYLWAKVFALDVFAEIKKHGLLNPEIGARYTKEILAPGGSKDPNELLENFLGRKPNQEAFFKDLGI